MANIQNFQQIQDLDDQIKSPSFHKKLNFITNYCKDMTCTKLMDISRELDRCSVINKLVNLLDYNIEMAIIIEASIFEFSIAYTKSKAYDEDNIECIYRDKYIDLVDNLDINSSVKNTYLKAALENGLIDPQIVAFLKPQQIFPEVWKKEIQRKEIKEFKKNNMSTTDIYKCFECGERKTKIIQMQLRSSDEPMTTIITCQVCYNVWKK